MTIDTPPEAANDTANDTVQTPHTMRTVSRARYGDSSELEIVPADVPMVSADEVLVEVRAAAIDRGTEHLMRGEPWLIRAAGFGVRRPKQPILGLDVAGVVRAVGDGVTRFAVGDEVFGIASGSLAEYAVAEEVKLSRKPAGVGFDQAAASTVSGITALQALTDVGGLEAGQRVLVIGASGGVGTFAVQLAVALGGVVDGVAGGHNADLVRTLGADQVFDHRTTHIGDIEQRYELVLDIGGRNRVRDLRRLLTADGTLVLIGGEGGNRLTGGVGRQVRAAALSPFVKQQLKMFVSTEHHTYIDRLAEHLDSGAVAPAIGRRFSFENAIDAVELLESGAAAGKIVVDVNDGSDVRANP